MPESVQRFVIGGQIKIGPEHRGELKFRVGALVQEEIAQPHFPAGTDKQVHVRLAFCIQFVRQRGFADLVGPDFAPQGFFHKAPRGANQLRPPAVIDGDVQVQAGIVLRAFLGVDERGALLVGHAVLVAQNADAHVLFVQFVDIVVISTATHEDLEHEWGEHGLLPYVTEVAGQEQGSKAECIRRANSGHYPLENVLMIGDAPGDRKAAREAGALFYPILAAHEAESWRRAEEEIAERFKEGSYAGRVMDEILEEFDSSLLKDPPWQQLPDEDMQ